MRKKKHSQLSMVPTLPLGHVLVRLFGVYGVIVKMLFFPNQRQSGLSQNVLNDRERTVPYDLQTGTSTIFFLFLDKLLNNN